ncbi:MAG TPA: hypothetical protein VJU86_23340 [Pyrinomonadaceae bacterium]|nr:hypothetical protein [Pyrinomonadaceae bacterium]
MTTLSTITDSQGQLPNQPFFSWLRTHTALFIGQIVGLLSAFSFLLALIYNSRRVGLPDLTPQIIGQFIVYAHFPFLVVFIAALIRVLDKNSVGRYRASLVYEKLRGTKTDLEPLERYSEKQVGKFKRRFLGFWCAMLMLYLAFAFQPLFPPESDKILPILSWRDTIGPLLFPFLTFALNNVSLLFVFSCFIALYLPSESTPPDATPAQAKVQNENQSTQSVNLAEDTTRKLGNGPLTKLEFSQRKLLLGFISLVLALTLAYPMIIFCRIMVNATTNWREYAAVFNALSGTINAVVLALLIARLDSKLIALPSWLICILYSYAGVQPLFVVFELEPEVYAGIKTAVLLVVFVFKIYLFLIIIYSLQTGRMYNYFFCSGILNDHVRRIKLQRFQATCEKEPPLASSNAKLAESSSEKAANEHSPETAPTHAGKGADDHLLVWCQRLGAFAIIAFIGLLLGYAAGPVAMKGWLASPYPKDVVIYLHLVLLMIGIGWFFLTRHKRHRVSLPSEPSRSKELSKEFRELSEERFDKFSEPEFKEEAKFKKLTVLTERQFTAFTKYFFWFWISLLLLYAALFVTTSGAQRIGLAQVSQPSQQQQSQGKAPVATREMFGKVRYPLLLFVLNNFTVFSLFCCFGILYLPRDDRNFEAKHRLIFHYSLLIAVLLTILTPLLLVVVKGNSFTTSDVEQIPLLFAVVGGTLNAVAFALLIARLDSRIIGIRSSLISILYGYAALQPLFVAFNQSSDVLRAIESAAVFAAFLFKICLILIVVHFGRSRGFSDYLWFFPVLHRSVNSVFHNQFEIRAFSLGPASFTFAIFNKTAEIYKTEKSYLTRAECDGVVDNLTKRMTKGSSYRLAPKPLQGTYWVQVTNSDGSLICESICLRSEEQAQDLINESIEKVPYCKYDRG